jgi:hypothetical protein
MITPEEWKKRSNWSLLKDGVHPPCQCCHEEYCPDPEKYPLPLWWKDRECRRFTEAAIIRNGGSAYVGDICGRINYWILGLDWEGVKP